MYKRQGYSNSIAYGVVTSVTNKISALDNEYNLLTTDIPVSYTHLFVMLAFGMPQPVSLTETKTLPCFSVVSTVIDVYKRQSISSMSWI